MVKKKASKKASLVAVNKKESNESSLGVSWARIGATLIIGSILGIYFSKSVLDSSSILQFIAIALIVLCLAVLLDLRRHVMAL
jgi:hypothetical protein